MIPIRFKPLRKIKRVVHGKSRVAFLTRYVYDGLKNSDGTTYGESPILKKMVKLEENEFMIERPGTNEFGNMPRDPRLGKDFQ